MGGVGSAWADMVIGTTSSTYGTAISGFVTMSKGQSIRYVFSQETAGTQFYHGFAVAVNNTSDTPLAVIRCDNWENIENTNSRFTNTFPAGWGDNAATFQSTIMNGASVDMTITYSGDGEFTMASTITKNENNYTYNWTKTFDGTPEQVKVSLEADHAQLTITNYPVPTISVPSTFDFSAIGTHAASPFDNSTWIKGTYANGIRFAGSSAVTGTAFFDSDLGSTGNQPYTLDTNEKVTVTLNAYHSWYASSKEATVSLLNSGDYALVSYTYNCNPGDNIGKITDVKIGGTTVTGFEAFDFRSMNNATQGANGFVSSSKAYVTTAVNHPVITISISKSGKVKILFTRDLTGATVNKEFSATLDGSVVKDLAKLVVADGLNIGADGDRAYGIKKVTFETETETAPTITVSSPATYVKKDATHTLTANVVSSEPPIFQWYSNTVNSTEGAVAIPSATDATYSPSTNTLGTTYYYAIATNAIGSTISNIVPVVVSDYQTEFSADATTSTSIAVGSKNVDLSDKVTISGGAIYATNNHTENAQSMIASPATGKVTFGLNTTAAFFKVVLDKPLQAGDVISAEVGQDGARGIRIYNTYTDATTWPSTSDYATLEVASSGFHSTSYTVKDNDDFLKGKTTIYIYRNTANNTWFDNLTISRPNSVSGKIGATGWSSFSTNYKLDLSTISGASAAAYYASSKDGSNVNLASTTAIVNAGEGLMIKGTPGETFTIGKTSSATTFGETNLLFGCPTATEITAEMIGSNDYYVVANNIGTAEFQKLASAITIPTGKAYLQVVKGGAKALNIIFEDETATGVEAPAVIEAAEEDGVYYNLNGQVVTKDYKGIVIKNGKKYLNK